MILKVDPPKYTDHEKNIFFPIICAVCFLASTPLYSQEESSTSNANGCAVIAEVLKKEFRVNKPLKDNTSVILFGVQEKDSYRKALSVCMKLMAKVDNTDETKKAYILPDGLGSVIINEVYKDDIFIKMSFVSDCNLPFTEIWYVSMKRYNKE